jgi:hypothetical protein
MSNLQIGFPDIPFNAVSITPSESFDALYPVTNTVRGRRTSYARLAADSSDTTINIDYDLGAATQAVNYLAICRADNLKDDTITAVSVKSSTDAVTYTNRIADASFDSATLYGPETRDYINVVTTTSAFRYWQVTFTGTTGFRLPTSKLFFGTLFDFNNELSDWSFNRDPRNRSDFVANSGATDLVRTEQAAYTFRGTWQGVTDATLESFNTKIGRYIDKHSVIIYSPETWDSLLDGYKMIHCKVAEYRARKTHRNYNEVILRFEQERG